MGNDPKAVELYEASSLGDAGRVRALLQTKANPNEAVFFEDRSLAPDPRLYVSGMLYPLNAAVCLGNVEVTRLLLEAGANVYGSDTIDWPWYLIERQGPERFRRSRDTVYSFLYLNYLEHNNWSKEEGKAVAYKGCRGLLERFHPKTPPLPLPKADYPVAGGLQCHLSYHAALLKKRPSF